MMYYDMFWNEEIYNMPWRGSYVRYEIMYKNYVFIITKFNIYDERIRVVLHYLLHHDGKYGELMHNCMLTFIEILSHYDEYEHV